MNSLPRHNPTGQILPGGSECLSTDPLACMLPTGSPWPNVIGTQLPSVLVNTAIIRNDTYPVALGRVY
jgi:hypothetical protein